MSYLIYFHAALGGIALLSGFIAAISTKGSKPHKRFGVIFHHSMIASIILSIIIAASPERWNPFLLGIGFFSLYAVVSGRRCLKSKMNGYDFNLDRFLAVIYIINGFLMVFAPYFFQNKMNIVLAVFGTLSVFGGINDLLAYKNPSKYAKERIKHHINKISGGYIAAVTAFIVVNELLPGYWAWFTPSVIGIIFATYYNVKFRNKQTTFRG